VAHKASNTTSAPHDTALYPAVDNAATRISNQCTNVTSAPAIYIHIGQGKIPDLSDVLRKFSGLPKQANITCAGTAVTEVRDAVAVAFKESRKGIAAISNDFEPCAIVGQIDVAHKFETFIPIVRVIADFVHIVRIRNPVRIIQLSRPPAVSPGADTLGQHRQQDYNRQHKNWFASHPGLLLFLISDARYILTLFSTYVKQKSGLIDLRKRHTTNPAFNV
jgi:hypothetical protein